jgi:cytochrome c-type biogenesis protein CcmH/NrfF
MKSILAALHWVLWIVPINAVMFGALVWLALLRKNEVDAMFLHGKTMFRIEAKGVSKSEARRAKSCSAANSD